jgi:hypothetical protein
MKKIKDPEKLVEYCKKLEEGGGKGILVSGGSDRDGKIMNLGRAIPALKRIKDETNLIVAVHTGYVDGSMANNLSDACDIAFIDLVGNDETARQVIGLKNMDGYVKTLRNLVKASIPVTPHITIGLHYGAIRGEYFALEMLEAFPIKKIVLNIICRTKGTSFESINIPSIGEMRGILKKGKAYGWNVALGCMRPRGMPEIEETAISEGVMDIAIPSKKAIEYAERKNYDIKKIPACCGLTDEIINKIAN